MNALQPPLRGGARSWAAPVGSRLCHSPRERGTATVELAVVLPLLLLLLVGVWEVGRMLEVKKHLASAAREGGRLAATGLANEEEVRSVVQAALEETGVPTARATIEVINLDAPSRPVRDAARGDRLRARVTVPCEEVRLAPLSITHGMNALEGVIVVPAVGDVD